MGLGLKTQPKGWLKSIMDKLSQNDDSISSLNENLTELTEKTDTHTHDDRYYTETEMDSKLEEKAPLVDAALTGTPTSPTPPAGNNTDRIATTAFVQTAIGSGIVANDAMVFMGTIGSSENATISELPSMYKIGWTYRVVTAGTYAGQECENGDLIIAMVTKGEEETEDVDSNWCVAQTNIDGAITGVKGGDAYIEHSQTGSVITITHKDVARNNTTSTDSPEHGGTFTAVKSVTSDAKGHVTGVDTETVTLPTYRVATQTEDGLESAEDKKKLDGIATGAEVNQNAYSNIIVGSTTIEADSKTDSLTLAGSNVTLTPDATNDKVTIGITKDNVTAALGYTPPTTDTVTTVSSSGSGNAVTSVKDNGDGSISVTKDLTFLTAHPTISMGSDTTSTASPAHGGTFTAIDSITKDSNGHVTKFNTKTVTLPADTKVTNALATTTKAYLTGTTSATTNTGTQVFDTGVYLGATAGELNSTSYKLNEKVSMAYNSSTESLDFTFV